MAIRDQKVYVLDLPVLASSDTQGFVDMEGDPDGRFVYLIGLLVVRDGKETCHSFWADTREDEAAIFRGHRLLLLLPATDAGAEPRWKAA